MGSVSKAPGANCDTCPLRDRPCVHPRPRRALLALVGERPDKSELEHGVYFAGATGALLEERILPYAGVSRTELSYHNAIICTLDRKLSPGEWKQAIACCAGRLSLDLQAARPKVIIAAGKRALQILTGRASITSWIGAPLKGWRFVHTVKKSKKKTIIEIKEAKGDASKVVADFTRYTVLPVMHPAWHFRGNNIDYLPVSRIHFARAKDLALGKIPKWTWPEIVIHPGEAALRLLKLLRDTGRSGKRVSVDVETLGNDPFSASLSCIGVGHRDIGAVSISWETYDAGKKWGIQIGVIDAKAGTIEARCRDAILEIVADSKIEKVAQNGQYDLMCFRIHGYKWNGPRGPWTYYDTMKGHAVYAPALAHDLAFISCIEFAAPRWKDDFHAGAGEVKGQSRFQKSDPLRLRTYNCQDNVMQSHHESRQVEVRIRNTHRGEEIFEEYQAIAPIADAMTWRGVKCDRIRRRVHHHALRTRMGKKAAELEQIAAAVRMPLKEYENAKTGEKWQAHFNPDSPTDWRTLFFQKLKVKPMRFSEQTGAPSLDEEALTPLITHPNGLVAAAAKTGLLYRRWGTLDRNHVRGLQLDAHDVVHPFWKPTGTIGWRWASSRPNSHNIPKPIEDRLPSGRRIVVHGGLRDMWIPHTERGWMVEADYKAIEYRIAAFLCGDKETLEAFAAFDEKRGPDLHTLNAYTLFGLHGAKCKCGNAIKDREPTKKERTLAKNFLYGGILYEGTAETIHAVVSIDTPIELSLIEHMIEMYIARHSALKKWHGKLVRDAYDHGYVEEPVSGRRRHFWAPRPKPTEIYNFPVQTLAGWIMNQGIKRVAKELDWELEGISLQVHDALVLDGPDPLRLAEILDDKMTYTLQWEGRAMKFPVDISVGGMTRNKETGKLTYCGHSSWAPSAEMTLDEIAKLPKGKRRLAK